MTIHGDKSVQNGKYTFDESFPSEISVSDAYLRRDGALNLDLGFWARIFVTDNITISIGDQDSLMDFIKS